MTKKLDPRMQRTKKLFQDALIELMQNKDYSKITVKEISERADLNRATFYLHYYDKDELLEQIVQTALNKLRENLQAHDLVVTYAHDDGHPIFVRLFKTLSENHYLYKLLIVEGRHSDFRVEAMYIVEEFLQQVSLAFKKNAHETKIPTEITIAFYKSAFIGVVAWWLKNDMPYSPEYMAYQLTILVTIGPFVVNPFLFDQS